MEITDVRIKRSENKSDRLKAFATITFDNVFVVRDLKIVDGVNGLFVAMPSRKASVVCRKCRHKSPIQSRFCTSCAAPLPPAPPVEDSTDVRSRMHRDIAHPITPEFRETVQRRVLEAFEAEMALGDQVVGAEADEEPISAAEMSEYDSLIADLRGTRGAPREDVEEPVSTAWEPFRGLAPGHRGRGGGGGRPGRGGRGDRRDRGDRPARMDQGNRSDRPDRGESRPQPQQQQRPRPAPQPQARREEAPPRPAAPPPTPRPQPRPAPARQQERPPMPRVQERPVEPRMPDRPVEPRPQDRTIEPARPARAAEASRVHEKPAREVRIPADKISVREVAEAVVPVVDASDDSAPFGDGVLDS